MNELFVYLQRSHQNLFTVSETCSCISKLNDVIETINSKNTNIKHSYVAVKNSSLNHLKSRDSKNDQIDATVLYVKGHTPKNLLPSSLISDKYCAEGKMLSRNLKTHQESLQKYVTELKNTILEYTGLPISPNANADDTCREAVCIVLSNILETKASAHLALKQQGDKDLNLIEAIKSLHLIDDKTIEEYIKIAKSKKEQKPTPREAKELKLFGTQKRQELTSLSLQHPNYKDLDLEYYEDISPTGHVTHKSPASDFKQDEIESLMSYANLFSIISLIQVIQNISVLIDDITTTISELIVPSNVAMSAACEIPSIGPMQAFELSITLGDISRFPSASDVLSYLGLVPSVSHTGHKNGKSRRLSKKGRKTVKKTLYLGQMAYSTRNHFNIKNASCSVWKNIAKSVSIFYSMIKNNKRYMPLKNATGHNKMLFKQFSKVKSPLISEDKCKKKPIELLGKRLTVLFQEQYKIKMIRDAHATLDEGYKNAQDLESNCEVIPPYFDESKRVFIDRKYERFLHSSRLSLSLFKDFNLYAATLDTLSKDSNCLKRIFSNNLMAFLDLFVNEISTRSYALKHTMIGKFEDTGLLDLIERKVNKLGKKTKDKHNFFYKAYNYKKACEMTLRKGV